MTHIVKRLFPIAILVVLATMGTGCSVSMRVQGPYVGSLDRGRLELNNNTTDVNFDVWVDSRYKGVLEPGGMGSFRFPADRYEMLVTVKAFTFNSEGKKLYGGVANRSFSSSRRTEVWNLSSVQTPSSLSGGGGGRSGGAGGRSGGGGRGGGL